VEGETEETFVNEVLAPHLYKRGYDQVAARIVGNARLRANRGGIRGWSEVKRDIMRHLHEDRDCNATTMIDYYGLPQTGAKAWPGRAKAGNLPFEKKADAVESAILTDISNEMGGGFGGDRFVPFVVMHEFEGLLFSDCDRFAKGIGRTEVAKKLQAIRDEFESPEHINDSATTAPSKRVAGLVPGYQKPLFGNIAALEIGLDRMRQACPHFDSWVRQLEKVKN
jgi:hypothetical protein